MRVIKTFDSLDSLAARFGDEVWQEISGENLFVYSKVENTWYQYRWASGRREIMLTGELEGDLPLVIQVFPT